MKSEPAFAALLVSLALLAGCSDETGCVPRESQYCEEGKLYWMDSCGNFDELIRQCPCGCDADHAGCTTSCGCIPECTGKCCGDDGCGQECPDSCGPGQVCNTQSCSCEDDCVPTTCAGQNRECGQWDDGCGHGLDCGPCPDGQLCSAVGRCESACPGGRTYCVGECVDTGSDPRHCGACDAACEAGQLCEDGSCQEAPDCRQQPCTGFTYCDLNTGQCLPGCIEDDQCTENEHCDVATHGCECDPGTHRCSGACVFDDSPEHCGTRCTPCPRDSHGTTTCENGQCVLRCEPGTIKCDDTCVLCGDPHGTPSCGPSGECVLDCDPGYHLCAGQCVTDSSVDHCGTRCSPCPTDPDGTARCVGGQCEIVCDSGFILCEGACVACEDPHGSASCSPTGGCRIECDGGYHLCAGQCVTNDSVDHCGTLCTPCPGDPNGDPTCDGSSCDIVCHQDYILCGGSCTYCHDPHGTPSCQNGQCSIACDTGYHLCGGACVTDTSVDHCGISCTPCPDDPHGDPTCDGGSCGVACHAGFVLCAGSCQDCPEVAYGVPICADSGCSARCFDGYSLCGGACIPTEFDDSNCGACGRACAGGQACAGGRCGTICVATFVFGGALPLVHAQGDAAATAAADFDADGEPDVAVAGEDTLSVAPGRGNGTFLPPANHPLSGDASWILTGDYDGDGRTDLAMLHDSVPYAVMVLLNDGNGFFPPGTSYPIGNYPRDLRAGDFDGDSIADLVTADANGHSLSVLMGIGDGTFQETLTVPAGSFVYSVAVGDFDEDDAQDLAAPTYTANTILLFPGNGDGTFGPPSELTVGGYPNGVDAGDLDDDGHTDLVVGNDTNTGGVYVFLGSGDGTFQDYEYYHTPAYTRFVRIVDIDLDGHNDVFTNRLRLLMGIGDGTFQPALDTGVKGGRAFAVRDMAGDDRLDLVVPVATGARVVEGLGGGTFDLVPGLDVGTAPASLLLVDMNADGDADLVTGNDGLATYLGNGDGTFDAAPLSGTGAFYAIAAAEMTGDGVVDVAALSRSSPGGSLYVLAGAGDGTYSGGPGIPLDFDPERLQAADVDLDGDQDLVVLLDDFIDDGRLDVFLNDGQGAMTLTVSRSFYRHVGEMAVRDFNLDGLADMAVKGGDRVLLVLGQPDGQLSETIYITTGCNGEALAAGDLDADGHVDLVVASSTFSTPHQCQVLLNGGDGTFTSTPPTPLRAGASKLATGDFDGDRFLDVVFADSDSEVIAILYGNGDATLQPQTSFDAYTETFAVGDIDGDGRLDLAAAELYGDHVRLYLGGCR